MGDDELDELQGEREAAPPLLDGDYRSNVVALPGMAGVESAWGLEDSIAVAFTNKFRDLMRFDHDAGAWYRWVQNRWLKLTMPVAFQYTREIGRERARKRKEGFKATTAAGAEKFARADPAHRCTSDIWDRDPMLLASPLGTIDLKTSMRRAANPGDHITKLTGCDWSAEPPARWLEFLMDSTGGDEQMISYLQRVCGYCLTGVTSEHALFFIYGPGGNGKSVFLNVLKHVLGDYATTAAMETFTAGRFNGHPTELAMLMGARGVFASETEEGRSWAEARIKALTGGDPISARFMRQDFFTFLPQFKLLIAGNHAPSLSSVDDAMRRRLHIIPFIRRPEKPDPLLEQHLRDNEAAQILGWMIQGCNEWLRIGLSKPQAVINATEEYFSNQDLFGTWQSECCRFEIDNHHLFTPTQRLFRSWSVFATETGAKVGDMKSFTPKLEKLRLTRGRRRVGGGNPVSGFYGVELLTPPGWNEDDR